MTVQMLWESLLMEKFFMNLSKIFNPKNHVNQKQKVSIIFMFESHQKIYKRIMTSILLNKVIRRKTPL